MRYEHRLRRLGRLLDQRRLRDVCVTEIPDGLLVVGYAPLPEGPPGRWRALSFEVTTAELDAAVEPGWRWPFGR